MKEVTSIDVKLTRADDLVVMYEYIALGTLLGAHGSAEERVEKLIGLEKGDRVLVRTVERKTGNSINTSVVFGEPCPF